MIRILGKRSGKEIWEKDLGKRSGERSGKKIWGKIWERTMKKELFSTSFSQIFFPNLFPKSLSPIFFPSLFLLIVGICFAEEVQPLSNSVSSSSSLIVGMAKVAKGNIFRIGGKVNLSANESATNLIAVAADAVVDGQIDENLVVIYGSVKLNSMAKVHGNAIVLLGDLTIPNPAQVSGSAKAFSLLELTNLILNLASGFPRKFWDNSLWWSWKIFSFLAIFLVQLAIVAIFPKWLENISVALHEKLFGAGVIGLMLWICAFPISLALFLSVVGIPILPIFLTFLIVTTFFGRIGVFWWVGSNLLGNNPLSKSKAICVSLGYLSYQVAHSLPYLGKLTFVIVSVIGLGICLRTQFGRRAIMYRNRPLRRAEGGGRS